MKTSKIILIILLILSLFTSAFVALIFIRVNKGPGVNSDNKSDITKLILLTQAHASAENDNLYLNSDKILEYCSRNGLSDSPVFVINYSLLNCKSCIDFVVKTLKEKIKDLESFKNILFVARDFRDESNNKYGNSVFLKPGKTLDIPADNCGMPFVFVYYRGQVLHTFIPDIANKNVFLSYLDLIFKRYNITG
ncbi:hypothetical protein MASR2M69_13580 [Bacteroidota bacterium]